MRPGIEIGGTNPVSLNFLNGIPRNVGWERVLKNGNCDISGADDREIAPMRGRPAKLTALGLVGDTSEDGDLLLDVSAALID